MPASESKHIDFALKVKGSSMTGAGIFDGDLAFIKRQHTAGNNQIVVAMLEDEATLKRYFKLENGVLLKPENPAFSSICIDKKTGKDFKILGVVTGLWRQDMK